ncbi:MAG TPA: hypothetical protein VGR37_16620 [Longimicrobiaceae bacterium]|nr:hypothetical protein [Longimicrobiaceae bacterium]
MLDRLVRGAAAGLAGTLVLQALRTASEKAAPSTMPPIRQDPGEYLVDRVEQALPGGVRAHVPALAETVAAKGLAAGYGITAGAVYGLVRPRGGDVLVDGVAVGLGTWAAGYLGWLPALGLMPPVSEQDAPEALGPMVRHALFGIAVVAAFNQLRRR